MGRLKAGVAPTPSIALSCCLSSEQYLRLKELAGTEGESLRAFVTEILVGYLDQWKARNYSLDELDELIRRGVICPRCKCQPMATTTSRMCLNCRKNERILNAPISPRPADVVPLRLVQSTKSDFTEPSEVPDGTPGPDSKVPSDDDLGPLKDF